MRNIEGCTEPTRSKCDSIPRLVSYVMLWFLVLFSIVIDKQVLSVTVLENSLSGVIEIERVHTLCGQHNTFKIRALSSSHSFLQPSDSYEPLSKIPLSLHKPVPKGCNIVVCKSPRQARNFPRQYLVAAANTLFSCAWA
jgi:hypothetical protein